jgi:hypothetical protein
MIVSAIAANQHFKSVGFLLLLTITSAACAAGRDADLKVRPTALLKTAFPAASVNSRKPRAGGHAIQGLNLAGVKWPWRDLPENNAKKPIDMTTVDIDPVDVVRLDAQHVVLVTQASPTLSGLCGSYGCQTAIGLYFYAAGKDGWDLTKRMDVAEAVTNYQGPPLKGRLFKWPNHGLVYAFESTFCAQGECASELTMFGLGETELLYQFGTSIREDKGADLVVNASQETTCSDLLDPSFRAEADATFEVHTCSLATGSWQISGDSLLFKFHGASRETDVDGRLAPLKQWQSRARVAFRDGKLQLVEGKLPEFGV